MNVSIILPVVAAMGAIIIILVLLIGKIMVRKEEIKGVSMEKLDHLMGDLKKENAQTHLDLQAVKEKVEAIDKMMKDI